MYPFGKVMPVAMVRSAKRPLFKCIFVALFLLLAANSSARLSASISNDTRLGQLCTSPKFWLPHMGVCAYRQWHASPGWNYNQWWLATTVDDYDGQLPKIRKGPLLLLDDRDLEYFPNQNGMLAIKVLGDAIQAANYRICLDIECKRNVETLSPFMSLTDNLTQCVMYRKDSQKLQQQSCVKQMMFFVQFSYSDRRAMGFRKTLSGQRIAGPLLSQFNRVSKDACTMWCMRDDLCTAINYAITTQQCQLIIQTDHRAIVDGQYDVYYAYYPQK